MSGTAGGPGAPAPRPWGCWGSIGVTGDRSCPELRTYVHCRNCPVFFAAASELFEKPAPAGYADSWTASVAEEAPTASQETSVLVFRIGEEWLALETALFSEVAETRPVHRIAHRSHTLLSGLVNIRGQLHLCVAMDRLLEVPAPRPKDARARAIERLAVLQSGAESWVFRVAEVHGVHRFPVRTLGPPPATLPASLLAVTRGLFPWEGRRVGLLHGENLVAALRKVIG